MGEGENFSKEAFAAEADKLGTYNKERIAEIDPVAKEKLDLERRISGLTDLVKSFWEKEYPHPNDIKSALDYANDIKFRLEEMLERRKS